MKRNLPWILGGSVRPVKVNKVSNNISCFLFVGMFVSPIQITALSSCIPPDIFTWCLCRTWHFSGQFQSASCQCQYQPCEWACGSSQCWGNKNMLNQTKLIASNRPTWWLCGQCCSQCRGLPSPQTSGFSSIGDAHPQFVLGSWRQWFDFYTFWSFG